jgi:two-component system CheB/CheR fusion protein
VLTITDISVLDKARARLAQLSAIVESSEDAIWSNDLHGVIETWNRGAERLYGYSAEEVIGRDVRFLCVPEDVLVVDRCLETVGLGKRVEQVEALRMRKDGVSIDVSITISPVFDERGNVVGGSAIARDVGQVRAAHREVARRQQEIQQLLDSTAEAIYGVDARGICTFCNPACVRLLGYESQAELIGRNMHELVHPACTAESPDAHDCDLENSFRRGTPAHSTSEILSRADGTRFAAEYWSHPVLGDDGHSGSVVTFLDITERRRAEEDVRVAANRRERFLALLSHELRNPLAAVLNAVRIVSSGGGSKQVQDKARQVVDRQGRHMARLLDDLLDVSRITNGKFEVRREPVRLDEVISSGVEALEPIVRDSGLTLMTSLPSEPLFVEGDGARLQQVVVNLLSNAARYSYSGSRVEVSLQREGDSAVLAVRDWGRGIERSFLPHIFDMFAQGEQKEVQGGLGIGLALVRRIVELHDGTVEAKSAGRDLGSEFVVRIPCSSGRQDVGSQSPAGSVETCRIVLVEDQADGREMMRALLELRGHSVVEAGDGTSAIEAVMRELPDVAIVDIGLPDVSGYDVARAVRAAQTCDGVFLIALTGYGSQSDVRAAQEAGFDAHVTKPAEAESLYRLIGTRRVSASHRRSGDWSGVDTCSTTTRSS